MSSSTTITQAFDHARPLFFALGEPVRQRIILLLAAQGELNVAQLTEHLPLSRPAISHHLKILRQAGLLQMRSRGTENLYSLTVHDALARLKRFVQAVEDCGGDSRHVV